MKTLTLTAALAAAALTLGACGSVLQNDDVTGSVAGAGVNLTGAPAPGVQAGYIQTEMHTTPLLDKNGTAIKMVGRCGVETSPNTYAVLNGQATASSSTTGGPASSVAINRGSMTGEAGLLAALGGGQAPSPEAINALNDCTKTTAPPR